ncbi:DUF3298 and DUF4163 domain-containing protein [Cytobacillus sp. IB215665]|uniref:DUF3298 and DUF4163 domain-containing protein n=1 Tax=Cytobacillus sp. IB215665 TaxID=3097357 RepID=UPI002A1319E1|nr:DUF3298 domain-containing protein [Cytobacillus sp. IB215665]MDX8365876.1 DUF3298 domain-containing protein [Cytobacillus sp. IB215665]
MKKHFTKAQEEYNRIPIPKDLDDVVNKALKQGRKKKKKWYFGGLAVATILLVSSLNINPTIASTLSETPVIGSIVKVLTFREYEVTDEKFKVDIKVPAVQDMENSSLETTLNEKYLEESQQLFNDFMAKMEDEKDSGGNFALSSDYEVKTDNEQILSIGRLVVDVAGSAQQTIQYDTIDKENELLITLPSLFKDESYVDVISENILNQMTNMIENEELTFWISHPDVNMQYLRRGPWEKIQPDQQFYINNDGKLVISFDESAVAPAYYGIVWFEIPTEVLSDILVSNTYLK